MSRAEIRSKERAYRDAVKNLQLFVHTHFPEYRGRHAQIDQLIADSHESVANFRDRSDELVSEFEKAEPRRGLSSLITPFARPKTPYETAFSWQYNALRSVQSVIDCGGRFACGLTHDEYYLTKLDFHKSIANDAARYGIALPIAYLRFFPDTGPWTPVQTATQHKILHEMIVEHHINKTWTDSPKGKFVHELTHERYACGAFFVFYTPTKDDLELKKKNDAAVEDFIANKPQTQEQIVDWFKFKTAEEKEWLRAVNTAIATFADGLRSDTSPMVGSVFLADNVMIWLLNRFDSAQQAELKRLFEINRLPRPYVSGINYLEFAKKMNGDRWTPLKLTNTELKRFVEVMNNRTKTCIKTYLKIFEPR